MKLITTDLDKYRANLYIRSACSVELAEELITNIDTAEADVRIIAALKNYGFADEAVRRVIISYKSEEMVSVSNIGSVDYDQLNKSLKAAKDFDTLMEVSAHDVAKAFKSAPGSKSRNDGRDDVNHRTMSDEEFGSFFGSISDSLKQSGKQQYD